MTDDLDACLADIFRFAEDADRAYKAAAEENRPHPDRSLYCDPTMARVRKFLRSLPEIGFNDGKCGLLAGLKDDPRPGAREVIQAARSMAENMEGGPSAVSVRFGGAKTPVILSKR